MKKSLAMLAIAIIITSVSAFGVHADSDDRGGNGKGEVKVEIKNRANINNTVVSNVSNGSSSFEISGTVDSYADNVITVNGQKIVIDPSQVSSFSEKGTISAGDKIKVEGIVKNGTDYAREINVIGTGQGRFKVEINGNGKVKSGVTPTSQPSGTVTPSPSPEVSPTGNVSANTTANVSVEVKARGPVEDVRAFIAQILSFLKNLV